MKRPVILALLLVVAALVAGCGVSTPTRFYSLSMLGEPAPAVQEAAALTVAVGPVEVPAYLDRSQIVCRLSASELDMQEFHQWAEPLKDGLSRVLAENLTSLLADDGVQVMAWQGPMTATDYRLSVRIIALDGSLGEQVELVAWWQVVRGDSGKSVLGRRSRIRKKVDGADVEALVAAHSAVVEALSREMAGEVRGLRR